MKYTSGETAPAVFLKLPLKKGSWSRKVSRATPPAPRTRPEDDLYLCRRCGYHVASRQNLLKVCGATRHRFINPAGIHFHIICFSRTLGAIHQGAFTSQFSWFPDYQWCYCHCADCFTHLGWYYRKSRDGFYGLIIDRLRENRPG